jgi:hypothetical protein
VFFFYQDDSQFDAVRFDDLICVRGKMGKKTDKKLVVYVKGELKYFSRWFFVAPVGAASVGEVGHFCLSSELFCQFAFLMLKWFDSSLKIALLISFLRFKTFVVIGSRTTLRIVSNRFG